MKGIRSVFPLLILALFFGMNTANAQGDKGLAAVKCEVHPQVKSAVQKHLESIMFETLKAFKTGFRGQGISDATLNSYFKAATAANYINKQTVQGFKAGSTLCFNIGMPPTVSSVLIIIPLRQKISKSQRLPYDMLGISAALEATLRKQGVKTGSSMAVLVNNENLVLGDGNALKKMLK